MNVFIQIGTNNGSDDFRNRVQQDNPDLVILVEPNKDLRESIKRNYEHVRSASIVKSVAITGKTGDTVKLHIPKLVNGLAKNGYGYNTGNFSMLPMDDWGEELTTIEAETLSFSDLCDMYGITDIDYLCIDTEGFDAEIIKTIDFTKYHIKELEYEYWGFGTDCYSRYGNKASLYGKNGMDQIETLLLGLGYEIVISKTDSMNRVAKLN
jgi:FkbM family methyltransferase